MDSNILGVFSFQIQGKIESSNNSYGTSNLKYVSRKLAMGEQYGKSISRGRMPYIPSTRLMIYDRAACLMIYNSSMYTCESHLMNMVYLAPHRDQIQWSARQAHVYGDL